MIGYSYLHTAIDDCSGLAYSEILPDERKETAAAFWHRARAFFTAAGITVQRVLTDNGACCKSFAWRDALTSTGIAHKRIRPYRPQTNGKAERFNRILLDEWAYARPHASDAERCAAFDTWLHIYNHHRGHTALRGLPPASIGRSQPPSPGIDRSQPDSTATAPHHVSAGERPFSLLEMGGQERDRTADLQLFRIKDHRAGLARKVYLAAQRVPVDANRRRCS